jgi:SAM-dependent methyltransferase
MNILLTNVQRDLYAPLIEEMTHVLPFEMSRKIARANVQQAWMVDQFSKVAREDAQHLCVGSYEDTAYEYLVKLGYNIIGIDPVLNDSIESYAEKYPHQQFHVVFSTSVIEHVENDEYFIEKMCQLIAPGGFGLLTCDYNPDYPNVPKPTVDARLYNQFDLTTRIPALLQKNGFAIYGKIEYNGDIDFEYEGCKYAFATMVFKKEA